MPRTELTITNLSVGSNTPGSGTAANADGFFLVPRGSTRRLILIAQAGNETGDGGTLTLVAGTPDQSPNAALGNLAVTIPDGATREIVIEPGRFLRAGGRINIDFTSFNGTVRCLRLPR